jgi:hypothetical protein
MNNKTEKKFSQEETQNKSGKVFWIIFSLLIAGSIFATYYRMMIQKNYIIEAQVDCDPAEKACFIWECDPISNVDGEKCTGNIEEDIWYYSLAKRKASRVPLCNPATDETCTPMLCDLGEEDCEEIFCNEENKIEQEAECNDPVEYLKNNPPEEEVDEDLSATETECESDDVECEVSQDQVDSNSPDISPTDSASDE